MRRTGGAAIIDSVGSATSLLAPRFEGADEERLYVAFLSSDGRLIDLYARVTTSAGQIDFPMREIIARALSLGSTALIVAHNHPSGDATPTTADIDATRGLVQAARPLGLVVRDHLVFARTGVTSFRARGLL